jgi:hypothetical protein
VLQDALLRDGCLDIPQVFELFQLGGTKDDVWFGSFVNDPVDWVGVTADPQSG